MSKPLPREFYQRCTIDVARDLVGRILVHVLPDGRRLSGRIVETEAYLGPEDPAAHSYGGKVTPRTQVMYGEAGRSYIYFIYGMYFCFNVITREVGVPEAVLIRALEPLEGLESMRARRPHLKDFELANGPGKLCLALELERAQNDIDIVKSDKLYITEPKSPLNVAICDGPRVGIGNEHDAVHWPLRFGLAGHPSLSKPRFPNYQE
jgi:DNA-3-methyladenine glycosylase